MRLTKNIKINVYEVIADYKVKVENMPFISILQFTDENDGLIKPSLLQQELLAPLTEKACRNLLDRLTGMGYFNKYDDDEYELTELGNKSAQKEEFFDQRHGLLKLYIAEENEFIQQRIVEIEELNRYDEFDKNSDIVDINSELNSLLNNNHVISLRNDSFILDKFEKKCKILKYDTELLTFIANNENSTIKILDFENIVNYTKQEIKSEMLKIKFGNNYLVNNEILKVDFSSSNLQFQRNIKIPKPQIEHTIFNPIQIENVKVNPKTIQEAKNWHFALLKNQINQYFFSDNEFIDFSNKTAHKFELYTSELQNITTRKEFASELDDKTDFYKKAKLETIDYLNY